MVIPLIAFALAIPPLAWGFLNASYKVKHDVHGWRILEAILTGAWVAETFGEIAVVVGVYGIIAHLSFLALAAFTAAIVLVVTGVPFLSFIGLIIYAMVQYNKQQKKPASSETTIETKEATDEVSDNS